MPTLRWLMLVLLLLSSMTGRSRLNAQPVPPGVNAALDSLRALRGASLQLSLITYGPGDDIWERFGHDALAVRDTVTGRDIAYNWGMFSFEQPNFVTRFLTGETSYWMEPAFTGEFNQDYLRQNRTVRIQRLALTPVERAALAEFMAWNALDANRFYRYDYYNDNCATRVRDALDRVLGGRLKAALDSGTNGRTWRGETERIVASDLPVYAGIEMALGRNADRPLTPWAESFLPERLADAVGPLVLRNEAGLRYRLVAHDSVIASSRVPLPTDPPDRLAMAALLGLTLAGLIAFLADANARPLRWLLVIATTTWYFVGGFLGTALLLAGTVTKHAPYMGSNITLWQINPLLLLAAVVVPLAFARGRSSRWARVLSSVITLAAVIGLLLQCIPALSQHSGVVIAVTLPTHAAIALALFRMHSSQRSPRHSPAAMARAA